MIDSASETPLPPVELLGHGHPFRQWKTWRMPGADLTLTGYSRANDKTFFHVPELRCALDAGLCEGRRVDTVFLTHTHHDHVKDLDFLAVNAATAAGAEVYVPAEAVPYVEAYLRTSAQLNHGPDYDPALDGGYRVHGVCDGDEFAFGRRGYQVRVVACEHKIPCVGYAFSAPAKRLVPELQQMRDELVRAGRGAEFGREAARRRKAGEPVEVEVAEPVFAFLGDTHPRVFERNPWLFDYPVIVTECTFLDDAEAERAERVGHTVWSRLRPVVEAHPSTLFVLTHFSLRHADREVVDFFRGVTGPDGEPLRNVVVWAHPESRLPEQHQHAAAG
ncbi:MBL fold metallo-hydrolase [Uniformispora flossi]|uniref:MBL fold metallo-hydrolase n=1 Tax=Uniformispora flossi TaxID=3390723 RepID=UPI003C2D16B3